MSQGGYTSFVFELLLVQQLPQLAVPQLQSMMEQMYLGRLHPTLQVGHTSKGPFETPSGRVNFVFGINISPPPPHTHTAQC